MFFLMIVIVILFQFPVNLFAQEAKFTCKDIEDLVSTMGNEMTLSLLKEQGMDCTCKTEEYLLRLKELGADESVMNAINAQCGEPLAQEAKFSCKDIEDLVRTMGNEMTLSLLNERGMDCSCITEGYPSRLKELGADESLINVVNSQCEPQQASLIVKSDPEKASVYINKEYKGVTPLTLNYTYSIKLNIEVKKDGYNDKSSVVNVENKLTKVVTLTLQPKSPTPPEPPQPKIEFEYYDASGRYLVTKNKVNVLAKNQISLSRLNYWVNNRFDIFLDLGGLKSALSESEKPGDMNFLYGGGIKWIIFSFPSLDLDLRGEFLSFTNNQEGIGTYKREIAWSEYDASTTLTSMAFQHIRPYFSVLLSKINSKVKYMNNMNQQIADFEFNESDPFGVAVGTKIVAGRFSLDGKIIATDINNSNSNKKSSLGYSIGMAFSF